VTSEYFYIFALISRQYLVPPQVKKVSESVLFPVIEAPVEHRQPFVRGENKPQILQIHRYKKGDLNLKIKRKFRIDFLIF
jgi:hypothetical protein